MNQLVRLFLLFYFVSITPTTISIGAAATSSSISHGRRLGFVYSRHRGRCTPQYWSSRRERWPKMVLQKSTVSNVFGSRAIERFRSDLTLLEATSRNDDVENEFARLLKQSSAALLNSYARKGFRYTAWDVKTRVIQGLVSRENAARMAQVFLDANLACVK